jgi:hypothetical protein
MKPGVLSFDVLERAFLQGFAPEARIFIQALRPDGLADNYVVQLKGWTNISIERTINTGGRATITLANINDRYFSNYGLRTFARESEASTRLYLSKVIPEALRYVKCVNPARRYGAELSFQGVRSLSDPQEIYDYINYVYRLSATAERRSSPRSESDLVDVGLIQRVFIDIKGQDGYWYAGFSGVISSIDDTVRAGDVPAVTITCKDAWRIFAMSEINLQIGPAAIEDTILFDIQRRAGDFNGLGVSTILDNLDGVNVIKRVMSFSQAAVAYQAYKTLVAAQRPSTGVATTDINVNFPNVADPPAFKRENFFHDTAFWDIDGSSGFVAEQPYFGLSTLRRVVGRPDGAGIPEQGTDIANLSASFLVDGNIRTGATAYVYQRLIRRVLEPFQTQKVVGDALVKKVADSSFFDVFVNGNGDVVYQIPRYNNFPGSFSVATTGGTSADDRVDSDSSEDVAVTPESLPSETLDYGKFEAGDFDYAPPPHNFAVKWHGTNYIITDLGLKRCSFIDTEEPIVSNVRLPGGAELIQDVGKIAPITLVGNTKLSDTCGIPLRTVADIQRRFGVRVREAQQIFIPGIFGSDTNNKPLLDAMALMIMQQLNASALSCTVELTPRPDLDVGSNVLLVERQRLQYILSWSFSIANGKEAGTGLACSYGHDLGTNVPSPFLALRDELMSISSKPSTLPVQDQAAGAAKITTITTATGGQVSTVTIPQVVGGTLVIPSGRAGVERVYGKFTWTDDPTLPGGHVKITDNFRQANIVDVELPISKKQTAPFSVHKLALPFFKAVFNRIRNMPEMKNERIRILQTYQPRKVWNNKNEKRLSFHSWGIAIDLAVGEYQGGGGKAICEKNAIIAPVFQQFGFFWGGGKDGFRQRDDIHFQLALPEGNQEYTVNVPAGDSE